MGDYLQVATGMPPWLPSPGAELVAEYSYYDFPTSGVIRQQGAEYLFRCLLGAEQDVSFWIYTLIEPVDRKAVESATMAAFDDLVDRLQFGKPAAVSIAVEGVGIVGQTTIGYWYDENSLNDAFRRLVDDLQLVVVHAREMVDQRHSGDKTG